MSYSPLPSSSMHEEPTKPTLMARIAAARFFTFSALVHFILLIFAGSIVLVHSMEKDEDFSAGAGEGLVQETESTATPPEPEKMPDPTEFKVSTPSVAPNALDVIASSSTLATNFTVQAKVSSAKLPSVSADGGAGKGIGDKLGALGTSGGRMGGKGFFGMRSETGKKAPGLVGTFYDAKQNRSRRETNITVDEFSQLITKFVTSDFRESVLRECYQAPKKLYTTQIFMPNMPAEEGPKAFEVADEVKPSRWLVHYQGKISPPTTGDYRFVGAGDDYLVVRMNNKILLDHGFMDATDWKPEQYYDYGWTGVPRGFARGDKFHAVAGQFYDIDILISERPGGLVFFCLMIEDQAVQHRKDEKGNPILPVFRLADTPVPELEANQTLPPYDPIGPVWKFVSK